MAKKKGFQVATGVLAPCFACNEKPAQFHYRITRVDGAVIEDQFLCASCCHDVATGMHDLETPLEDIVNV